MDETRSVPVDGGSLHVEIVGEGRPVILIHGGLGSLRMWDQQVPALAERYRVIRYDTRGWGESDTGDVSYADHDDVTAVLDAAGAPTAAVIGQSRGGGIALDACLAHPDRFEALISVAGGISGFEPPPGDGDPPPWDEMQRLWDAKDWSSLAELETKVWVDGWGQPATRVDAQVRSTVKEWIRAGYAQEKPWGDPQQLQPPAAERLADVQVPTLVLVGGADAPAEVAAGRHLAGSVDGAKLVEFDDVAHMIHLEGPNEFNEIVLGFLMEVYPPGG